MIARLINDREEREAAAAERRAEFDRQNAAQRQEIAERESLGAQIRAKFTADINARSGYKKTALQKLIYAFCGISNDKLSSNKLIDQVSFACSGGLKEYLTRDQIAAHTFAKELCPPKAPEFHQTFEKCCQIAGCSMPDRYPGKPKPGRSIKDLQGVTNSSHPVKDNHKTESREIASAKDQLIKALSPVFTTDEINTMMLQMRVDNIDAIEATRRAIGHKMSHISKSRAEEMILAALNIEGKIK